MPETFRAERFAHWTTVPRGAEPVPVIAQEFQVQRPTTAVWDLFQDVPNVVSCMPGAELMETIGPNQYKGKLSVKLGPVTATFEGEAVVEDSDPEALSAVIRGKGIDKRGGSRGSAKVTYRLAASGTTTMVSIDADVKLQGRLAQFGRTGLLEEVSKALTAEFVACLELKLAATTPEQAATAQAGKVKGIRLFFIALWRWIKSLFRRDRNGRDPVS